MFEAFIVENPDKEIDVKGLVVDCWADMLNGEVWNTTNVRPLSNSKRPYKFYVFC